MTVDQMGSWADELIVHCTPMAEAWIRREHEFSDNYSAFFNQHRRNGLCKSRNKSESDTQQYSLNMTKKPVSGC